MSDFVQDAIKAQEKLCEERGLPHFAPRSGVCWSCQRQIYDPDGGYNGASFVTGCCWCHRSYCD